MWQKPGLDGKESGSEVHSGFRSEFALCSLQERMPGAGGSYIIALARHGARLG